MYGARPSPIPSMSSAGTSVSQQQQKMSAFRLLKPTCVELMSIAPVPPTSSSSHTRLIQSLANAVQTLPQEAFTPSLINYLLFPITQILRQNDPSKLPDTFLESVFRLLALVVTAWKGSAGGMDRGVWEQLWRFTLASVGPGLEPRPGSKGQGGKGKGKAVSQETQFQAVTLLTALLGPTSNGSHPSAPMLETVTDAKSPLMPTLFQTVTMLLELISPHPADLQLQLSSLRLLRSLIGTYLLEKYNILAALLPGTVSSVTKLVHAEGKKIKGEVAKEALGLVQVAVTSTLADEALRKLGVLRSRLGDLSELVDEWTEDSLGDNASNPPQNGSTPNPGKDPFPPLSESYLSFTSTQLQKALIPLMSTLSAHANPITRQAIADLAFDILTTCRESLPLTSQTLTTLLLLSRDEFDPLRQDVQRKLRGVIPDADLQLSTTLIDLLSDAINSLPRLILSKQDEQVGRLSRLATAIADLTSGGDRNPIAELLGPSGHVERWSGALLTCLEFGRPPSWRAENDTAKRLAERGWEQQHTAVSLIEASGAQGQNDFPTLPFRHVESERTHRAIREMLVVLGSASDDAGLHTVEYMVNYCKANHRQSPARSVPALWVAQQLLKGIADGQVQSAEERVSRATRKMSKEMTRVMTSLDVEDEDEVEVDEMVPEGTPEGTSDTLLPFEHSKGVNALSSLLDHPVRGDTHATKETQRLATLAQRSILSAFSLSTLALTSEILSSSFPLLTTLYHILAYLASPQSLVQSYAEIALSKVAFNTGYAGVENLILTNVDYIINVVSQRLTRARLSPTAPLVLIAMIRLVGGEIVPMVHDVVDEIFDALDDYHGYETLASGLLAVLVTLIDVMAKEVDAAEPSAKRLEKLAELRRVEEPPNAKKDIERFGKWYEARNAARKDEINQILERAPQHAWGKLPKEETEKEDGFGDADGEGDAPMEELETPPTRMEEVCAQIVEKSLNFLSHRSPFLRARILSLLSRATPVLAAGNREGDLLPLIDRHWKIILTRLDDTTPYVVTEAAGVIAALCEHCGDFMGKRILDQAWPKFKAILQRQQAADQRSALAKRGVVGSTSEWTVSHRLHISILLTAKYIVEQVPVGDGVLWEMMVLFRPMIDKRAHEELQKVAMEVYECLGERDGDALWAMLRCVEPWEYLREPGLDIAANTQRLLEAI